VPPDLAAAYRADRLAKAKSALQAKDFDGAEKFAKEASDAPDAEAQQLLTTVQAAREKLVGAPNSQSTRQNGADEGGWPPLDAKLVLRKPRSIVRKVLGQPTKQSRTSSFSDAYAYGSLSLVVMYERGVANALNFTRDDGPVTPEEVRAALKLPDSYGPVMVNNRLYRVSTAGEGEHQTVWLEDDAAAAAKERADQAAARRRMAAAMEQNFLREGMDATVRAVGKDGTVLQVNWVLCNRATVFQLTESGGQGLREAGFKRIACNDQYESTTWVDLE